MNIYKNKFPLARAICISLLCAAFSFTNALASIEQAAIEATKGSKQSFNADWLFYKGDVPDAEKPKFEDRAWRSLDLPHDWAIEGPFSKEYNARTGGLPVHGTGWYRKHFTLPKADKGKIITLAFDGAMYNAQVYINGKLVGSRPFGYIGFEFDISRELNYGDKGNVIAIKLAPEDLSSRWYPGAGIYRDVWLEKNEPLHFVNYETVITTPTITDESAAIQISSLVINTGKNADIVLSAKIKDAANNIVAQQSTLAPGLKGGRDVELGLSLDLKSPRLWDIDDPYLYSVELELFSGDTLVDTLVQPLGVRMMEVTINDGFHLNDRRVQIQGVCLHHDNGPLGAVANRRAIERKLEIMKAMGVNSVRTSHNPPSPILVELADKMGIMLQVEAFDVWKMPKKGAEQSYNIFFDEWHERDLRDMVRHFRNNPSVIMWSIGNEIMEQLDENGADVARRLVEIVKEEDLTRTVSAGFNMHEGAIKNKLAHEVDVPGFNYKPLNYREFRKDFPNWRLLASETSSVTSTRGVYHFPLEKYKTHDSKHVTSYDIIGPVWAYPPDIEFLYLEKTPSVMGEYMWTGFDYLGEPTPYGGRDHVDGAYWNADWPARSSSFGAVDLVGLPKDRFYLYQSQWTTEPMVHVLPHWNWENKVGDTIPVFAYTNAEQIELFVNGKSKGRLTKGVDKAELPIDFRRWESLGEKDFRTPYRLRWDVKYQPGELRVVAYTDGKVVAEKTIKTAGAPAKLLLEPDRTVLAADGQDLSYITVSVLDKDGNFVPNADNILRFFVEGKGEIAAVGNGDSTEEAPFQADYRRAFSGKAVLIVKSLRGEAGDIKVRAWSDQLLGAEVVLTSN